jgi:16S rRNA (adenine1518-N6/adenine1519-N6)-dimethyltransferase
MTDVKPNKNLGQHWLKNENILTKIAAYAKIENDTVLEIGPGLGFLTNVLIKNAAKVVAVEFDRDLAEKLTSELTSAAPSTFRAGSGVTTPVATAEPRIDGREDVVRESSGTSGPTQKIDIINADFLQFDLNQLPPGYKVVANIPYYITNKIIMKLLTAENKPSVAVLLVQKEVAERLAAQPGAMSILSVAAQLYATVELGEVVPAAMFTPPPKVDSQVVILTPQKTVFLGFAGSDPAKEKQFFRIVKAGFSARRKKLRSSLAGGLNLSKPETENLLKKANIDPNLRAQDLSLDDWRNLAQNAKLES